MNEGILQISFDDGMVLHIFVNLNKYSKYIK